MFKYSPHLKIAHGYWKGFLQKNDIAIDATGGNGHDSLFLSKLLIENLKGRLLIFDIQEQAIHNTELLLKNSLKEKDFQQISFFNFSHENFQKFINFKVNLIVYNLGYLPGSNKKITTKKETTLQSIKSGLQILARKGAMSITCYPRHLEGAKEEKALLNFFKTLDNNQYSICYHKWINKDKVPSFIWLTKK